MTKELMPVSEEGRRNRELAGVPIAALRSSDEEQRQTSTWPVSRFGS
jgi:hypothetical protein